MHDPLTVAFEIHCFWLPPTKIGFRRDFITIWHHDPEINGDDDSCGWSYPRISRDRIKQIEGLAEEEYDFAIGELGYRMSPFELIYWAWQTLGWRYHKQETLSHKELVRIIDLASNPVDNLRYLCEGALTDAGEFERLLLCVYRSYLKLHRPWWKHPRFHVHHWKIQIHPLQQMRRFLFDRCEVCGQRFPWGYSPIGNGAPKPSNPFVGHPGLRHHDCENYSDIGVYQEANR